MEDLSKLLWATQGITAFSEGYGLRAAPSAGALYPIETYVFVNRSQDLESGIYHYFVPLHSLEILRVGNFGGDLTKASLDQEITENSAFVFAWTAVVERAKWKYLQRAYRYIYLEAGHIAQNLSLAAESMSLGCCSLGAFFDDEINDLLQIDGKNEIVVYMASVGPVSKIV